MADGLYKVLATAFMKGDLHRKVSYLILAKKHFGAKEARGWALATW